MFKPVTESQITSAIVSEFAEDLKKYAKSVLGQDICHVLIH